MRSIFQAVKKNTNRNEVKKLKLKDGELSLSEFLSKNNNKIIEEPKRKEDIVKNKKKKKKVKMKKIIQKIMKAMIIPKKE